MKLRIPLLLLGLIIVLAPRAAAAIVFTADITRDQEVGPINPTTTALGEPRPVSFGTATFILNDAMTALSFTATINNIDLTGSQTPDSNDDLVSAHIHASALSVPGVNGAVVFGFFGAPFNDTSGSTVATPFASGVGGTITSVWDISEGNNTTLTAQLPNLLAGRAYINFHTFQFPAGEIRGQIQPVPEESSSALLLILGLGSVLAWARRK